MLNLCRPVSLRAGKLIVNVLKVAIRATRLENVTHPMFAPWPTLRSHHPGFSAEVRCQVASRASWQSLVNHRYA
jgi:hypothetical protein